MVAQSGDLAMVRLLLDKGADVDATAGGFLLLPVFKDDTPLALAAICNHREGVDLLLRRGANPNRIARRGYRGARRARAHAASPRDRPDDERAGHGRISHPQRREGERAG